MTMPTNLIIIITLACTFVAIISTIKLCLRFNQKIRSERKIQQAEVIKKKFFITSTGHKLPYLQSKNNRNQTLIIAATDLFSHPDYYCNMIANNLNYDWFCFGRRNIVDPFFYQTINHDFNDLLDVYFYWQNKTQKKIIIMLEGWQCLWVTKLLKQKLKIPKIILVNPGTSNKAIKIPKSFLGSLLLLFGNHKITARVRISHEQILATELKYHPARFPWSLTEAQAYTKHPGKWTKSLPCVTSPKIYLFQNPKSIFCDVKKIKKLISRHSSCCHLKFAVINKQPQYGYQFKINLD